MLAGSAKYANVLLRDLQKIKERVKCFCNFSVIVTIVSYTRSELLTWLGGCERKGTRWGGGGGGRLIEGQLYILQGDMVSNGVLQKLWIEQTEIFLTPLVTLFIKGAV